MVAAPRVEWRLCSVQDCSPARLRRRRRFILARHCLPSGEGNNNMMMVCEREEAGLLALRRKKRSADGCMQSEMRGAGGEQQRQMKVPSAAAVEGKARRRKERRQRQARQEPDKSVVAASGTNLGSSTCGRQYPRQEDKKEIAEGMPDAPAQCCTLQAAEGCRFGSAIPMTPRLSHRKACSQVHDDHQQQYD